MYKLGIASIFAVITLTWGNQGGAPPTACKDMTPQHGTPPQSSPIPYLVSVNKKQVKANEKLEITISGTGNAKTFKGFLLQVRNGEKAVGKFDIADTDKYVKATKCFDLEGSAATHKNAEEKKTVTVNWIAPAGLKGDLKVYVTVAKDGGTFWVHKPVASVKLN